MRNNEALTGARGQIAWIVALVVSTVAILYFESLGMGAPPRAVPAGVLQANKLETANSADAMLAEAEAQYAAAPEDAGTAAALLVALAVAVEVGSIDATDGHARVGSILQEATAAGPEWQPLIRWAASPFAASKDKAN